VIDQFGYDLSLVPAHRANACAELPIDVANIEHIRIGYFDISDPHADKTVRSSSAYATATSNPNNDVPQS
jgi:hypothetical protein